MPDRTQIDEHIGERIRLRRTELGLTQERLAASLAVSYQQIQKYESGANRIAADSLWRLALRLEVPISYFFDGLDGDQDAGLTRALGSRGGLDLLRGYAAIRDGGVKQALTGLVRAVAERTVPREERRTGGHG